MTHKRSISVLNINFRYKNTDRMVMSHCLYISFLSSRYFNKNQFHFFAFYKMLILMGKLGIFILISLDYRTHMSSACY